VKVSVLFLIKLPETIVREGLNALMFFLFSPRDLRGPSADRRKILPHQGKFIRFYNPYQKMWGLPPFP